MATYVLVHGGGHGGWCYQPVARLLRAKGHDVYAPSLTGLGDREHLLTSAVDLDTHITDVVNVMHFEDLHDVILVGHSYGGMVITGVADRATDRVGHLVWLDAAMPHNDQSLVDVAGPTINPARTMGGFVNGIELVLFPERTPPEFYGVADKAQIEWMKARLTPHPWRCFEQKLRLNNENAMRRIPQSIIACSQNLGAYDKSALEKLTEGRFWHMETGHDLMITEPEWTADKLMRIAKA
jgi:pimeloyl-ACP methyl ester carboxylesterase